MTDAVVNLKRMQELLASGRVADAGREVYEETRLRRLDALIKDSAEGKRISWM